MKYLLQPPECGDESEAHTVREWLTGFDIKLEDEAFIRWHIAVMEIGDALKKLEQTQDMMTMVQIWATARILMYLNYNTAEDFLPQLERNIKYLLELLGDIPKLKELMNHAGRA